MILNTKKFHANGKILLTGEYLVLYGAEALAIPLCTGQSLEVKHEPNNPKALIDWTSLEEKETWFHAKLDYKNFTILEATEKVVAEGLMELLIQAQKLNNNFLSGKGSYEVVTRLEFNRNWGFGSSSTLISTVARWAKVDPFKLFFSVANGSGYDVACAETDKALIYKISGNQPVLRTIDFNPPFLNKLYLVYLEKKQSSTASVVKHKNKTEITPEIIEKANKITTDFSTTHDFIHFQNLMEEHEELVASLFKMIPVKKKLFGDFPGTIKSLGAWGGDFVLVASPEKSNVVKDYFKKKGFTTIFEFKSLALL